MAKHKDPAFLFYPESFLVGVMDMTDEEVGQYIKLLCRQHQQGHLKESVMARASEAVREKFVQDDEGLWYNIRLQEEIDNRKRYTDSRRKNLEGRKKAEPKPEPKPKDNVASWVAEIVPPELQGAFMEWARMRAHMKKPIPSKTSVARNYNQLVKLSKRTDKQIAIIEQSVDKCWLSFYEVKEEVKPKAYKEFEEEKPIDAVPMPEEIKRKADALGYRVIGG